MWGPGNYLFLFTFNYQFIFKFFCNSLPICGFQNVTDDGLSCISRCVCLTYLNLSWYELPVLFSLCNEIVLIDLCNHLTGVYVLLMLGWQLSHKDAGPFNCLGNAVILSKILHLFVAYCTWIFFGSLFGIVGVTDVCLEALSKHCSRSLTTLDVNGCIGIKVRIRELSLGLSFFYLFCNFHVFFQFH